MKLRILALPGDGIGPEVMDEARRVLEAVGQRHRHRIVVEEGLIGGLAIDTVGAPLPPETLAAARKAGAVLLGAVGGARWDNDPNATVRPEQGLLALRRGMKVFANIRPVKNLPFLTDSNSLRPEVLDGVDLVVIRELTGGLYFGKPQRRWSGAQGRRAVDTLRYSEQEVERVVRIAFEFARRRRNRVTSVDKANVLESSRLWREVANEVARDYPDVTLEHLFVDACAMHLIRRPADFDVIVTENMFGDILTDEASMLAGSMGMLPSASLGRPGRHGRSRGLFEPIHGSAYDIAGQGKANPIGMILSAAMMLRLSFGLEHEAAAVEEAVSAVLQRGLRTPDIAGRGEVPLPTAEMGRAIANAVLSGP
ncbi:MAG TPA: 3-isopropylmalate dehydrogenase [Dehalococcoidia bacterium]|nr:3-isopropylmalate dehydrogenase [Dehalococcoidia bacterium]